MHNEGWEGSATAMVEEANREEYFFKEGCYIVEILNTPVDPRLSVARARVEPGVTTRWHWLEDIEERYLILEGVGRVEVGNEEPRTVRAGDLVSIPAGCRQRITNTGDDDLLFLALCTPRFQVDAYHAME